MQLASQINTEHVASHNTGTLNNKDRPLFIGLRESMDMRNTPPVIISTGNDVNEEFYPDHRLFPKKGK